MKDRDDPNWPPDPIDTDVDNSPPTVAIRAVGPVSLNVPFTLTGTASDDVSVAGVVVSLDGGPPFPAQADAADWSAWRAPVTFGATGNRNVIATATDRSGKSETAGLGIQVVDPTGPVIALAAPTPGPDGRIPVGTRTVTVEFTAVDPESAVVGTQVLVEGQPVPVIQLDGARWSATIPMPSTTVPAGGSNVAGEVRATNRDGAVSSHGFTLLALDQTPPRLTFSPADGAQVPGTLDGAEVEVRINASDIDPLRLDSGTATVAVRVDSDPPVEATATGASGEWVATVHLPAEDSHTVTVTATDVQGNATPVSHTITVALATDFHDLRRTTYLADLVQFAENNLLTGPNGHSVPSDQLTELLHQPLDALASSTATRDPVPALRIVTQALQGLLDAEAPVPYAQWRLDEGAGTRAAVHGIRGTTGEIVAGSWGPGRANAPELSFDGATSFVEIGDSHRLDMTTGLTMAAWVRPTGPGAGAEGGIIVNKEGSYTLARFADETLRWAIATQPANTWSWIDTQIQVPQDEWHHVALSYDGATVRAYLDGAERSTIPLTGTIGDADPNMDSLRIGGRQMAGNLQAFAGAISDVRLYDRALSAYEMTGMVERARTDEQIWIDDALPDAATATPGDEGWPWTTDAPRPQTGQQCHRSPAAADEHQHGVTLDTGRLGFRVHPGDLLFTDVWLDPADPPSLISLGWQDDQAGWHTAEWGQAREALGPVPPAGVWARLVVAARQVDLERRTVRGLRFAMTDGGGAWDRTGRRSWRTRDELDPLPAVAYRTLLREIGTSYDELRLARTAASEVRSALADRLAISLTPNRPDELDQLLLSLSTVTDADLQRLFGYSGATTATASGSARPLLATWREGWLRATWQVRDEQDLTQDPTPVVDPDLVYPTDISPAATAVLELRNDRAGWVRTQLGVLQSIREGSGAAAVGFAAVVGNVLDGVDLDQLETDWRAGQRIEDRLAAADLTLGSFVRLRELGALAEAGTVMDEEWDELYSIGVQVLKTRAYPAWVSAETAAGVRLEPGQFLVPTVDAVDELPAWRATWTARLARQDSLRARVAQLDGLAQGLATAVRETEQQCLPTLRDALVAAVAGGSDPKAVATGLTQLLHLEINAGGAALVNPVDQASQSLQSLLFAARTRTLDNPLRGGILSPAASWILNTRPNHEDAQFDAEWQWMGSYATWRAAMSVFMSPENLLLPTLDQRLSPEFRAFVAALDDGSITTRLVQKAADAYAAAVAPGVDWPGGIAQADRDLIFALRPPADVDLGARHQAQIRVLDGLGVAEWANAPQWLRETLLYVPLQAASALQDAGQFLAALDWLRSVYAADADTNLREVFAGFERDQGTVAESTGRPIQWLLNSLNPHDIAAARGNTWRRRVLMAVAGGLLDFADAEFSLDTSESQPRARTMYLLADELLGHPALDPPPAQVRPPNPVLALLRLRCEVNLGKLRAGFNIAGMPRSGETVADESSQDVVAAGPGALTPPRPALQPSPYRFSTLLTRAQQLLASAGQVEAAYLASLEKRDLERYNLFKARQDLEMSRARVDLQSALVEVAGQEEELADLQRQRAALQWQTYNRWITEGPNADERAQRKAYEDSGRLRSSISDLDTVTSIAQTAISVASSQIFSVPVAVAAGFAFGIAALARNVQQSQLIAAETTAQTSALEAGWQRRANDWVLARNTADKDVTIARQQRGIAGRRTNIARGEASIATLQQGHADATVAFLAGKFTNADLYSWMSGVLGDVYRALLQQATVVARLAEQQLAFERQDAPPPTIKADYWSVTTGQPVGGSEPGIDRGGLTGSARLLGDLATLEQYAFDTNKRKLQLPQSFSLAALAPREFQEFRESGVLPFRTPMALFDRGFPGHYLRTIRKLRVSVVGLIPPVHGVRASLTSSGVSRVIVRRAGGFSAVTIRRTPEVVALTSPVGASGVFDLDLQPELLLPFEGTGVDTSWRFLLPRPANPFDLRNISDVVVTLDYTALYDATYAEQVIRELPTSDTGVRTFSLRDDFPDSWYALIDAAEGNRALVAQFGVSRSDFPTHLDGITTEALALYVVGRRRSSPSLTPPVELGIDSLTRTPADGPAEPFGSTRTADGVVSTLAGTGAAWQTATGPGRNPLATWDIALTSDPPTRKALTDGSIADLVFAVSYRGNLPPWPS